MSLIAAGKSCFIIIHLCTLNLQQGVKSGEESAADEHEGAEESKETADEQNEETEAAKQTEEEEPVKEDSVKEELS